MQKKPQLDSSSRFDTIPACDRQTRDDHTYRASLASRGKNAPTIARSRPIFTHAVSILSGEIHSDTTLPRAVLAAENNRQLWLIKYTVSQKKTSTFLFFDQLILIILGMLNPEKI